MAETGQGDGSNADPIVLAGRIISAQQAELDEVKTMLELRSATAPQPRARSRTVLEAGAAQTPRAVRCAGFSTASLLTRPARSRELPWRP